MQKLTGHAFNTIEGQLRLRVPCGEVVPTAYYGWKEVHEEDMESISHLPVALQVFTLNRLT